MKTSNIIAFPTTSKTRVHHERFYQFQTMIPSSLIKPGFEFYPPPSVFYSIEEEVLQLRIQQWNKGHRIGCGTPRPAVKKCYQAAKNLNRDLQIVIDYNAVQWRGTEIIAERLGITPHDWAVAWLALASWEQGLFKISGVPDPEPPPSMAEMKRFYTAL